MKLKEAKQICEALNIPEKGIFAKSTFNPSEYKDIFDKKYNKILENINIAKSEGYTFGPLQHADSQENAIKLLKKGFDKKPSKLIDPGMSITPPGGIYFHPLRIDKKLKNIGPSIYNYNFDIEKFDLPSVICMVKAKKFLNFKMYEYNEKWDKTYIKNSLSRLIYYIMSESFENGEGLLKNSKIVKKWIFFVLKKYLNVDDNKLFEHVYNQLLSLYSGRIPSLIFYDIYNKKYSSLKDVYKIINNYYNGKDIILKNSHFENILKFINSENYNGLTSYLLKLLGYDPIIVTEEEIIIYDPSIIKVVGMIDPKEWTDGDYSGWVF